VAARTAPGDSPADHDRANPDLTALSQWKKQMLEGASEAVKAEARASNAKRMYRPRRRSWVSSRSVRSTMELSG